MTFAGSPLSRSLLGVKRTWAVQCKCLLLTQSGHRSVFPSTGLRRYDAPSWASGATMRRREFVILLGGAAVIWPLAARAQKTARIPRIGVLWHAGSAEEEGRYFTGFIEGLRDLGYADGSNIILEHRFPNEMPDRFRTMAAELVSLNVEVLVSVGSQTAFYAKDATTTIPIVFIFVPDPIGSKFVSSFARPGGNATGLTHFAADLIGKRLQFLKETIPGLSHVALLVNPDTQVARLYTDVTDKEATKLGLSNHTFSARSRDELEPRSEEHTSELQSLR